MAASAFSGEVKHAIFQRQAGRCAYCGMPCTIGHFHHRKPRRMGGSGDPALGRASNGVMLHPRCHDKMESDREWALTRGWLLTDGQDPESVPVKMWDGWRLLQGQQSVAVNDPALGPVTPREPKVRQVFGSHEVETLARGK